MVVFLAFLTTGVQERGGGWLPNTYRTSFLPWQSSQKTPNDRIARASRTSHKVNAERVEPRPNGFGEGSKVLLAVALGQRLLRGMGKRKWSSGTGKYDSYVRDAAYFSGKNVFKYVLMND